MDRVGALPKGFRIGKVLLRFEPELSPNTTAKMHVGVIELAEEPSKTVAGVFTKNAVVGAPVTICREELAKGTAVRGLVTNNKVSNVGVKTGVEDARRIMDCVGKYDTRWKNAPNVTETNASVADPGIFLPASTGVIGWKLPANEMVKALEEELVMFDDGWITALGAAVAITTTDRYPKVASFSLPNGARVVGVAKGAGMIEPNLATMLAFIMTDAQVDKSFLQEALEDAVKTTFNRISIDGDQSTSDMVLALSSNKVAMTSSTSDEEDDSSSSSSLKDAFRAGLAEVCSELAHQCVRNGEGTNHVIRFTVKNAPSDEEEGTLVDLARFVVNGPLLKTCIAGNDPNVGRLMQRVGQFLGERGKDHLLQRATVTVGDVAVFEDGIITLTQDKEKAMREHFESAQLGPADIGLPDKSAGLDYPPHARCVDLAIDFHNEQPILDPVVVLGSDLTYQYVRENADYRS